MEQSPQNPLFPVFFKLDRLRILVIGGGEVGLEKMTFLLKSSPNAQVRMVAKEFRADLRELVAAHSGVELVEKAYEEPDLAETDLLVIATNDAALNRSIWEDAKARGIITNVADTPALCDFYMGSIVTRGDVKIAISTNGQSPTLAKRLRQFLEASLPDSTADLAQQLRVLRDRLSGDFRHKVEALNAHTARLLDDHLDDHPHHPTH